MNLDDVIRSFGNKDCEMYIVCQTSDEVERLRNFLSENEITDCDGDEYDSDCIYAVIEDCDLPIVFTSDGYIMELGDVEDEYYTDSASYSDIFNPYVVDIL